MNTPKITASITGQLEESVGSLSILDVGKHVPRGEIVSTPAMDIVTICRDGEEIDEVAVEPCEDAAPYDAAVRNAGYDNFTWI
ncbi:hypothetical protein [Corynebacterium flavescens]|uniref:Uncharacterized protein n=1 Tax=Corynebacterium flavescens TaxID=28028 RepID=A0A1L7CNF7_CORFL|nr:hypothetical protein [Corynebacterium flavescens]APT87374.1 hypothetical protein CFLV_09360 [Corynebacterium flavescens]KAA8720453.1 hypothetical protein F4V60_09125 [Corynebacterium flavescens]GEB97790.1 hypothetical protein CFL01nite_12850 [Corynebacterium flavescens]